MKTCFTCLLALCLIFPGYAQCDIIIPGDVTDVSSNFDQAADVQSYYVRSGVNFILYGNSNRVYAEGGTTIYVKGASNLIYYKAGNGSLTVDSTGSTVYYETAATNVSIASGNTEQMCAALVYHDAPTSVPNYEEHADAWRIYPNPANSGFQVQSTLNFHSADLRVLTLSGKVVLNSPYQPGEWIATDEWESGLYLIEIQSADRVFRQKLMIR